MTWLAEHPNTTVDEAVQNLGMGAISRDELKVIVEKIVKANKKMITERGDRALGPLMGMVMKEVRGRADGKLVNELLRTAIRAQLNSR